MTEKVRRQAAAGGNPFRTEAPGEGDPTPGEIQACLICEMEDVPGLTVVVEHTNKVLGNVCGICLSLGLEGFARGDLPAGPEQNVLDDHRALAKAISLGFRGLHDRMEALAYELEDVEEPAT